MIDFYRVVDLHAYAGELYCLIDFSMTYQPFSDQPEHIF